MLALVAVAQPGPFFSRTVEFGGYIGIRRKANWSQWPVSDATHPATPKSAQLPPTPNTGAKVSLSGWSLRWSTR